MKTTGLISKGLILAALMTYNASLAGIPEEYGIPTIDGGYMVTYLVTGNAYRGSMPKVVNIKFMDDKIYFNGANYDDYHNTIIGRRTDQNGSFNIGSGALIEEHSDFTEEGTECVETYNVKIYALGVNPLTEQQWFFPEGVKRIYFNADENGVLRPDFGKTDEDGIIYGVGKMNTDYHKYKYGNMIENVKYGKEWTLATDVELTPVSPGYWLMSRREVFEWIPLCQEAWYRYRIYDPKSKGGFREVNDRTIPRASCNSYFNIQLIENGSYITDSEGYRRVKRMFGVQDGDKVRFLNHQIVGTYDPIEGHELYGKYYNLPIYMQTVQAELENAGTADEHMKFIPLEEDLIMDFDGKNFTNPRCSVWFSRGGEIPDPEDAAILPEIYGDKELVVDNIKIEDDYLKFTLYDLTGREVKAGHPAPGIYICNGRKILVR